MLSWNEKEEIAKLMSKMSVDDGDHDWLADSTMAAFTSKGRTDYVTACINDKNLTADEVITVVDDIDDAIIDAAKIRAVGGWAP